MSCHTWAECIKTRGRLATAIYQWKVLSTQNSVIILCSIIEPYANLPQLGVHHSEVHWYGSDFFDYWLLVRLSPVFVCFCHFLQLMAGCSNGVQSFYHWLRTLMLVKKDQNSTNEMCTYDYMFTTVCSMESVLKTFGICWILNRLERYCS